MSDFEDERRRAAEAQRLLVPPSDKVVVGALTVYSAYEPLDGCGGDWWTAVPLPDGDALAFVGDVTGHGSPAAIVTGMLKGAFEVARVGMGRSLKPQQLLTMLNRVVGLAMMGRFLATAVAFRHRAKDGVLTWSNAGHPPFWVARPGEVQLIRGDGAPALGLDLNQKYQGTSLPVQAGDLIVLYTDGLTEAENEAGDQLGERAIEDVIRETMRLGPEAVRDAILALVDDHCTTRTDDHTLVVLHVG